MKRPFPHRIRYLLRFGSFPQQLTWEEAEATLAAFRRDFGMRSI